MNRTLVLFFLSFLFLSITISIDPPSPWNWILLVISMLMFFLPFLHQVDSTFSRPLGSIFPWLLTGFALVMALSRSFYFPNYTDDFFRYFWDAILVSREMNPYAMPPTDALKLQPDLTAFYHVLNSKDYFSVYPPFTQYFFQFVFRFPEPVLSAEAFVVRFQLFLMLGQLGGLFGLYKWYQTVFSEKLPTGWIMAFLYSPLLIIQGVLEIHADMIAAILIIPALLTFFSRWWVISGILFSMLIWTKLTPLFFLPFLFFFKSNDFDLKAKFRFMLSVTIFSILLWMPFFTEFNLSGFLSSLKLYAGTFEYNSFIYALGLNVFDSLEWWTWKANWGFVLALIFSLFYCIFFLLAKKQRDLISVLTFLLYSWIFYLLFSSTIHPWYFLLPFVLAVLIKKMPLSLLSWILFSFVTLSWLKQPYQPNAYWEFRIIEYSTVILLLFYDLRRDILPLILKQRAEEKASWISGFIGNYHVDIGSSDGLLLNELPKGELRIATDVILPTKKTTSSFVIHGVDRLPFDDQSVDSVSAIYVLHHSAFSTELLHEMTRISRGTVILIESLSESAIQTKLLWWTDWLMNGLRSGWKIEPPVRYRTASEWKNNLEDLEYSIIHEKIIHSNPIHPIGIFVGRRKLNSETTTTKT